MQVLVNPKEKGKKQDACWAIDMWGLYCWGDLNIYLVLFRDSFENKNQSRSKTWRWWWGVFELELINILQS